MKIAFFTETYKPTVNGVTQTISNLKTGLEKLGHEVFVFAPKHRRYKEKEKNVIRVPSLPNPVVKNYPLAIPHLIFIEVIKALHLDVVHTHHPFLMGDFAERVARELNAPLVFTAHTQYQTYAKFYTPFGLDLTEKFVLTRVKDFANRCDVVIAPSKTAEESLIRWGVRSKVRIVPNCLDLRIFEPGSKKSPRNKRLVYVGRLAKEKNLKFLIEAFGKILKHAPNTRLTIIGSGIYEAALRRRITSLKLSKRVDLLGEVENRKLPDFYRTSDIFVTASKSEVMPVSLIEAQACGLPIVAVTAQGTNDIVRHGKTGFLVPEDQESFSQACQKILKDRELRQTLSQNAAAEAEKYSIETATQKLLEVYNEVLNR